jgi:hypothetical protein
MRCGNKEAPHSRDAGGCEDFETRLALPQRLFIRIHDRNVVAPYFLSPAVMGSHSKCGLLCLKNHALTCRPGGKDPELGDGFFTEVRKGSKGGHPALEKPNRDLHFVFFATFC